MMGDVLHLAGLVPLALLVLVVGPKFKCKEKTFPSEAVNQR